MNRNYRRGRAAEYAVMKRYRAWGFLVIRSAGSHGLVDVVAVNAHTVILIQVKRAPRWKDANVRKLAELEVARGVRKIVCHFPGGRKPMKRYVL